MKPTALVASSAPATRATVQISPGSLFHVFTTPCEERWTTSSAAAIHSISPEGLSW